MIVTIDTTFEITIRSEDDADLDEDDAVKAAAAEIERCFPGRQYDLMDDQRQDYQTVKVWAWISLP